MNEMIAYLLYIISVLGLLIAYVIARSYIKALEEYIITRQSNKNLS